MVYIKTLLKIPKGRANTQSNLQPKLTFSSKVFLGSADDSGVFRLDTIALDIYTTAMDISIVIPAFEENEKISNDLEAASAFLQANKLKGEIIVVDDGSRDATTKTAQSFQASGDTKIKVMRLDRHRGKGCAVRTGIIQSQGRYVMFTDTGACTPFQDILKGLNMLKSDVCDIAHGSRKLKQSKIKRPQSLCRRLYSRIFRWVMICLMKIPSNLTDSQCGFKIYKGDIARSLYTQCITDGFAFDIEIILRAKKQGLRIKEFPIDWTCDSDSRLNPARNLGHILSELINIKGSSNNCF